MKRKLTQAEYDALSDIMKGFYKQAGDDWLLQLEGDDPAFEALKAEKAKAQADLATLTAKTDQEKAAADEATRKASEDAARAAGDTAALEASWKQKAEADVAAAKVEGEMATKALTAVFVDTIAQSMADAISTVPALMLDTIKKRLSLEIVDGVPITRVLSADGKPSALSLVDLQKEFVDNKDYASIIKASDAQGGGAGGANQGSGAPEGIDLSKMTATEEAAYANANPVDYAKLIGN